MNSHFTSTGTICPHFLKYTPIRLPLLTNHQNLSYQNGQWHHNAKFGGEVCLHFTLPLRSMWHSWLLSHLLELPWFSFSRISRFLPFDDHLQRHWFDIIFTLRIPTFIFPLLDLTLEFGSYLSKFFIYQITYDDLPKLVQCDAFHLVPPAKYFGDFLHPFI